MGVLRLVLAIDEQQTGVSRVRVAEVSSTATGRPGPALVNLERTRRLNYDFLFTYLVHPGTAIYAGYSDRYENLIIDPGNPLSLTRTML